MKESTEQALSKYIQSCLDAEKREWESEKKRFQNKYFLLNEEINILKTKLAKEEEKNNEWIKYKIFYYTHFGICPQCEWNGWWNKWEEWIQCGICEGTWELKNKDIREYIKRQYWLYNKCIQYKREF